MSRNRSLTNLLADVRYQADIEGLTTRHTDANLTRLINQSIQAFRLKISTAGHPYYLTESTGTTTAGTSDYALPADFVQLYAVDLTVGTQTISLSEYSIVERNDYSSPVVPGDGVPVMYRLQASNMRLLPTPDAAYSYKLLYLPVGTDLSGASDNFDGIAGWEDWIVFDVARKVLSRDDDDEQTPKIERLLATCEQHIMAQVAHRSRGVTHRQDYRGRDRRTEARVRSPLWRA